MKKNIQWLARGCWLQGALLVLVLVGSPASAFSPDNWKPGAGWTLAWADEFTGASVDTNRWAYDLGGGGFGNKELQVYTRTNATIRNGELVITAVKDEAGHYTSSRLKTQGKASWKYGKVAARIRLPYGQGIWPAFWMLGDSIRSVGWPKCGEIDIMELIGGGKGRDSQIHGTLHFAENGNHAQASSGAHKMPDGQPFYQDYHVFEVEWSSTLMVWKLDGVEYFRTSVDPERFAGRKSFQEPFFIILNLAVGGNWPGYPDATTVFPQSMYVDWMRVYRQAD
ncbi:MAG TPA: glycoside hydrolase family 16 protein [Bacillota bacterium]|nr:glycoside hydrolase family 16 protein [Bacillota bacterium]